MIVRQQVRGKKVALGKHQLACWTFMHCSMYGSYRTACKIIERHDNNMVTIEYFDIVTKDLERRKCLFSTLTFW